MKYTNKNKWKQHTEINWYVWTITEVFLIQKINKCIWTNCKDGVSSLSVYRTPASITPRLKKPTFLVEGNNLNIYRERENCGLVYQSVNGARQIIPNERFKVFYFSFMTHNITHFNLWMFHKNWCMHVQFSGLELFSP